VSGTSNVLWDLPTRLCHWAIVCCVPLAWWSAETERYEVHEWVGYTVLVLVLSRLIWGLVGSRHSRFSDFLAGPATVFAYVREGVQPGPGHNPLGGWSVVALLGLLLLQAVSGLFNTDDVFYNGPLYYAADSGLRDSLGALHDWAFNLLLGLVALHVLAVCYYQIRKGDKLLQAMVKGRAQGKSGLAAPVPAWLALLVVALGSLGLWWGLGQAPQPQPMAW